MLRGCHVGCQGCLVDPLTGAEGALGAAGAGAGAGAAGAEGAAGALELEVAAAALDVEEAEGVEEDEGTAELAELPDFPALALAIASAERAFFP